MDILKVAGNSLESWSQAIAVMVTALITLLVLKKGLRGKIACFADKIKIDSGQILEGIIDRTKGYFLAVIAIYFGSLMVELPPTTVTLFRHVTVLVFLLQLGVWIGWVISCWVDIAIKEKKENDPARATGIGAIGFLLRFSLWVTVLLLALDNLGFNVTTVLAGLGVGGIAVALAVQNILGDLFASLTIILDKPFVIGDSIVVGEFSGTVEHIGLKTTLVRSISGEQIVFPNSNLLQSRIKNFNNMRERRIEFSLTVDYRTSKLKEIPDLIAEIIRSYDTVRFDRAHFKEYGESGLIFEIVYYVLDPDYKKYMDIRQSINLQIFDCFKTENIEFAYPRYTALLSNTPPP